MFVGLCLGFSFGLFFWGKEMVMYVDYFVSDIIRGGGDPEKAIEQARKIAMGLVLEELDQREKVEKIKEEVGEFDTQLEGLRGLLLDINRELLKTPSRDELNSKIDRLKIDIKKICIKRRKIIRKLVVESGCYLYRDRDRDPAPAKE